MQERICAIMSPICSFVENLSASLVRRRAEAGDEDERGRL